MVIVFFCTEKIAYSFCQQEVRIYKSKQEVREKKENTHSTKKPTKKTKVYFFFSLSRALFLSFFFFSLIAFLVESVFSCILTFMFSFMNSHLILRLISKIALNVKNGKRKDKKPDDFLTVLKFCIMYRS